MQTFGPSPNEVTYGTMLDGLCKNGKIEEAIELFESMEGIGALANIEMYTILIHGLCRADQLEDARKMFHEIPEKGLVPNVVTYNTMMSGLFHRKMSLKVDKLIIEMEEKCCLPTARTYDTIIKGFFKGKETEKALQFLRKMLARNLNLYQWPDYMCDTYAWTLKVGLVVLFYISTCIHLKSFLHNRTQTTCGKIVLKNCMKLTYLMKRWGRYYLGRVLVLEECYRGE
ncbi:hypothetical protein C5167_043532, partial [Papaver somniferum]